MNTEKIKNDTNCLQRPNKGDSDTSSKIGVSAENFLPLKAKLTCAHEKFPSQGKWY